MTSSNILKMPSFLRLLFFTAMWERFSYYGMRALLVLFLTSQLGFTDTRAYAIYALFAALGYTGPVLGGVVADKWLGFRQSVLMGGVVIALGHFLMLFMPQSEAFLYLGLGFIAVGTGLFKGNITSLVGACYKSDDKNRDTGYTMFFVGINLGAMLAMLSCGAVASQFGWHYGFGLAGIGMVLGVIIFMRYQYVLGESGLAFCGIQKTSFVPRFKTQFWIFGLAVLAAVAASVMVAYSEKLTQVLYVFGLGLLVYLGYVLMKLNAKERTNTFILLILTLFFMLFFALEMQLGALFNLFTDRNVDKVIFGYFVPTAMHQAINPLTVFTMGPILSALFFRLGRSWTMKRFGFGLSTLFLCFLVLYWGCKTADARGMVAYPYLALGIGLMSVGELCLAPLIQNLYSQLAPRQMKGFMMGVLMLSLAFSNLIGNWVARTMAVEGTDKLSSVTSLAIYLKGFEKVMMCSAFFLFVFGLVYPLLHRHLVKVFKLHDSVEEMGNLEIAKKAT